MVTHKRSRASTRALVKKAEEFHGHLGPFLAIGIRIGQIGLRKLDLIEHANSLRILLRVLPKVPYSCVIDGIQISTGCTLGNQRLCVENAGRIEAKFKDLDTDKNVTVSPQPAVFAMLKEQIIGGNLPEKKLRQMAWTIASMSEEDLCNVENG